MDQPKTNKITDEKVALAKAEHYCAYQERSQQEVRDKLYEWGLYTNIVENIIIQLIAGNFINEERFANAYVRGKFNQKGWGKNKIKQGLKFKRVSDVLIKKALNNLYKRKYKLQQYALGRGYENDLIADVLKDSNL
jgi:regulatory protein